MTSPRRNRVDLHTHTDRSDGVLPPLELYARMRRHGMALVAITDHDTFAGTAAIRAAGLGATASPEGPRVVAGIEINCVGGDVLERYGLGRDGEELHILGYGLDIDDPGIAALLARQRAGRRERIGAAIRRLADQGIALDLDPEASGGGDGASVGRPHVARALVRAGHATSVDDAFARYLSPGAICYVPRMGIGPREAIEVIVAGGGLAVLAHSPSAADRPQVMRLLMDWGLGGLEVHYHAFDPILTHRLARFAEGLGLVATGGSDYHGDLMDYATAQATTWVPQRAGEAFLAALEARAR